MATITRGRTFQSGETVTPEKLHQMVDQGNVTAIVDADISATAAITAAKLAAALDLSSKTVTLPSALPLNYPVLTGVREAIVNLNNVTGTQTLNLHAGNIFQIRPTGNVTIAFSNIPASGTFVGVLIRHEGDGTARTYTWPANTRWAYGEPPVFTSTNGRFDIISFFTYNGGTNWFGQIIGQNYQ